MRARLSSCLLVCIAAIGATPSASRVQLPSRTDNPPHLTPGVTLERTIGPGQSHAFQLALRANQFVYIVVQQRGADIRATLLHPDGHDIAAANAMDDAFRQETIAAVAEGDGTYTLTVQPVVNDGAPGRYSVRLEELRERSPGDDERVEAERRFARALAGRSRKREETLHIALADFNRALERYRRVQDRPGELKALIEVGATEYYLLRPEALESGRRAEALARELGDRAAISRTLRLLGNILIWRGDVTAAITALEESIAISHAMGNIRGEVIGLNETGRAYRRSGDFEKAIAAFERALPLARAARDRGNVAMLLGNMAVVYKQLGAFDRASDALEQSLATVRASGDVRRLVVDLINLGNIDRQRGNYASAIARHTESLSLARQAGLKQDEAAALGAIGLTYYALGEYPKALEYSQSSLALRRQIDDVAGQGVSLNLAGRALHALGEHDQAVAALQQAVAVSRDVRREVQEAGALGELAAVERDRGNLVAALEHISAAVQLEDRVRRRIRSH